MNCFRNGEPVLTLDPCSITLRAIAYATMRTFSPERGDFTSERIEKPFEKRLFAPDEAIRRVVEEGSGEARSAGCKKTARRRQAR
jgi:hypothetical protein